MTQTTLPILTRRNTTIHLNGEVRTAAWVPLAPPTKAALWAQRNGRRLALKKVD